MFCAGLLAFAAGSTWAAFSGSTGMLIAARASMGIGGAVMMPATLSLITSIFTVGACVAIAGCVVALAVLPSRRDQTTIR